MVELVDAAVGMQYLGLQLLVDAVAAEEGVDTGGGGGSWPVVVGKGFAADAAAAAEGS